MSSIRKLFSGEEWEWFCKVGASYTDPEQKKVFFEAIKEKKLENPNYSLFTDFPKEGSGPVSDPTLQDGPSTRESAPGKNSTRKSFKGEEICRDIIHRLKGGSCA